MGTALDQLADTMGVARHYVDGLGRLITVEPETLIALCGAMGAPIRVPGDAPAALRDLHRTRDEGPPIPPVIVAWAGVMPSVPVRTTGAIRAVVRLEDGRVIQLDSMAGTLLGGGVRLGVGYHTLEVETASGLHSARVISAPLQSWRPARSDRRWGVATHLAALRSRRSGALGDLHDLETVGRWVAAQGGNLVTALPLLPTFNTAPAEPSPYSPVSRLFWSELVLGPLPGTPAESVDRLDVTAADREVRAHVAASPETPRGDPPDELERYARFRGAQARLGRNWRQWPPAARDGRLADGDIDPDEARFHRRAQTLVARRAEELGQCFAELDVALGLDLAVGVHPDGYDPWSRPHLFAPGTSVGAPPDPGFPAGQDWGFAPLLPEASRRDGHRYFAATVAHQAAIAGVLRIDHIMALTRLYWIPHDRGLHQGTYVNYPLDELLAVVIVESHRHHCEIVGENLGTVPPEIDEALPRHGIRGMKLALFEASAPHPTPPSPSEVAMIGTHDTPTFVGWIEGRDIEARVEAGLLDADAAPSEQVERATAVDRLAEVVGASADDPADFFDRVLVWLARSDSPLVIPWIEDLWNEADQVNLPGTSSSVRPNWQRPMAGWLEELLADPQVAARLRKLDEALG